MLFLCAATVCGTNLWKLILNQIKQLPVFLIFPKNQKIQKTPVLIKERGFEFSWYQSFWLKSPLTITETDLVPIICQDNGRQPVQAYFCVQLTTHRGTSLKYLSAGSH